MTIPVGFGQCTFRFAGTGLPTGAAVVVGFENVVGQSATDCATTLGDAWESGIVPALVNDVQFVEAIVKLGPDDTGASAAVGYNATGAIVGEHTPPNTAYLVQKTTALGGRRGRGRMFVPGCDESKVGDTGSVDPTKLAALQLLFDAFLDVADTAQLPLVVLHGPATEWVLVDGQPRRVPIAGAIPDPTPIVSLVVSGTVATQRRRLRR